MSLSINKLSKFLANNRLSIKTIYTIGGQCTYLDINCTNGSENFLLYIPSKYEIPVGDSSDVYSLEYIEVNEDGTIPENYAGEPDNNDLEKTYNEIDLSSNLVQEDMVEHLEESYQHSLSLKDITKKDTNELKAIFRQLKRFKFCVQSLNYKLAITYKNYICCIRRDDTFEGFLIKNFRGTDHRSLKVTIDLESLYKKISSVEIDVRTVKEGIYQVLDKNQFKHTNNLQKLMESRETFGLLCNKIIQKKKVLMDYLTHLQSLLDNLCHVEKANYDKITEIGNNYSNNGGIKGLHTDIEKSHVIAKYENEISRINTTKKEIVSNIHLVQTSLENVSLKMDKICFDNTVMLDAILKNFVLLGEI